MLLPQIERYLTWARQQYGDAPGDARRSALQALGACVRAHSATAPARLVFICTHNSRRSHLAQAWAAACACRAGLGSTVVSLSGGTEVTACNPRVLQALREAGFRVEEDTGGQTDAGLGDGRHGGGLADGAGGRDRALPNPGRPAVDGAAGVRRASAINPTWRVTFAEDAPPVRLYSKRFDAPENLGGEAPFVAIMTCAEADAGCPLIPGARTRIALPYEDPKVFDGTSREEAAYRARCAQIAAELMWALGTARD